DVLGMAGPDSSIAGMMPCTVIRPGDMADQILDGDRHPDWHGRRSKMVMAWPANEKLWVEYASLRAAGLRRDDRGAGATEFYRKNRAAMDAGARVSWEARFPPECLSAIQNAMNLKLRDEAAFFAEYQNEPLTEQREEEVMTAEDIAGKLNRRAHGTIPTSCGKLVAYVDVHKRLLYYVVMALEPNFTGYIVDYGAHPDQKRHHFAYRTARRTLLTAHRGKGEEAAIYAGLEALTAEKLGAAWPRDDGAQMRINLCVIDSGYQKDTVELFCRQSRFAPICLAAKGLPVSAANIPLEERPRKKGEEIGDGWRVTGAQGEHSVRLALIDTNHWKSFLHARLAVGMGDAGCLSLWGKSEIHHRMLAEHWTAEGRTPTEGRGRKLNEWRLPAHKPDNHLFDCAVGCLAGASMLGVRLLGEAVPRAKRVKARKTKARYF
ncbi:MAG: phage terminase large subunit family protein, partial [Phycisphaerae bacterium]|nr:phage terminase large subunit family protein [Phycisphaerae bacterium]